MSIDSAQREDDGKYRFGVFQKEHVTIEVVLKQIRNTYEVTKKSTLGKAPRIHTRKELVAIFDIGIVGINRRLEMIQDEIVGNKTIKEWYDL